MNDQACFQRLAGVTAALAAVMGVGSAMFSVATVNGNTQAYLDLTVLAVGPAGANLFRWAMILDAFASTCCWLPWPYTYGPG